MWNSHTNAVRSELIMAAELDDFDHRELKLMKTAGSKVLQVQESDLQQILKSSWTMLVQDKW